MLLTPCATKGSAGVRDRSALDDRHARSPERERQHHRHEPDRGRADEEPGVGAERIVDEAAGPGAEAHSERRDEEHRAVGTSHHLLAEELPRDEGVERHHAPVRDAEHHRGSVEAQRIAGEEIREHHDGLQRQAHEQGGLAPTRSAIIPHAIRPAIEERPDTPRTVAATIVATPWSIACVTMWKIGPAWAAQQAKWVIAIAQNCGALKTSRVENSRCRVAAPPSATAPMSAGAFLTRSATGITTSHARSPSTIIATRQS